MRKQNSSRYWNLSRVCICGITILLAPVMTSWGDGLPVCETTGTSVIAESGEDPRQEHSWEVIERIAEAGKLRQSEIRREIQNRGISSGSVAITYLTDLAGGKRELDPRSWRFRVRICLEILQCMPDETSVGVLRRLVESEVNSDATRTEILYSMCLQEGGLAYVEHLLQSQDDSIRGAAICALSRVQSDAQVRLMIQTIRGQEGDLTGTFTAVALSKAQTMLELSQSLSQIGDFGDKLRFLLDWLPYEQPPLPGEPVLGTDPVRTFVWRRLEVLWHEDTKQATRIIEEIGKENARRKNLNERLIADLSAGTCPIPRSAEGEVKEDE